MCFTILIMSSKCTDIDGKILINRISKATQNFSHLDQLSKFMYIMKAEYSVLSLLHEYPSKKIV